jgi:aminoglycoside phosphotransferase (APT) family kinase protein
MTDNLSRPTETHIREALGRYAPALADEPLRLIAEGWTSWAFLVGDHVLRFPKHDKQYSAYGEIDSLTAMETERRLLGELAPTLPLPVPVPDLLGIDGPNGMPFIGHRYVEGVPLRELGRAPADGFGARLGGFLRALHAFSAERAIGLGAPLMDGPAVRLARGEFYERVIRRVFPLISCEARAYTEARFDAYLNDGRNFDFEPRLIHHDLDRQNTIVDPESGDLCGVIDFGDAVVGNPAVDFWMPFIDFGLLGIGDQAGGFLDAYGREGLDLERIGIEVEFVHFLWPFHDMLYGLGIGDAEMVAGGIRALNESLPADLRC